MAFDEDPKVIDTTSLSPNVRDTDGSNALNKDEFVEQEEDDNPGIDPDYADEEPDVVVASVKTEEPYKLVTDAASNFVNKDVKFTRDKDVASNDYVAYSFKVGKFEFERKKSR